MLEKYLQWIKAHERLVLVVLGGFVLWFAIGKIDTLIANHDAANLRTAEITANIQADWNAKQAQVVAQQAAEYKALAEKVTAQNAALEAANITLATALTKQQKADSIMTESELISRWAALVPTVSFDPTPVAPNGGFVINDEKARATVIELERVPVLSTQIENDRIQIENDEKLLNAGISEKQSLYAQVDGLKLQIVDDAKVCKDQVTVVKAEARKSKRKWFAIGFVAGFISRQFLKF